MDKSPKKSHFVLDRATTYMEIALAFFLLLIVVIRIAEVVLGLFGVDVIILMVDFEQILSTAINLVIGIEFTRMLYKHTPETVIDVLLFAIARQMVIYHDTTIDLLVGVMAITGLFLAKRFLIGISLEN